MGLSIPRGLSMKRRCLRQGCDRVSDKPLCEQHRDAPADPGVAGSIPAEPTDDEHDFATYGHAGGKARAARLTPEQRSAIARKAAAARWKRKEPGNDVRT